MILLILDYDDLVRTPQEWLSQIFAFIGTSYDPVSMRSVSSSSLHKANYLPTAAARLIAEQAEPVYRECVELVSDNHA